MLSQASQNLAGSTMLEDQINLQHLGGIHAHTSCVLLACLAQELLSMQLISFSFRVQTRIAVMGWTMMRLGLPLARFWAKERTTNEASCSLCKLPLMCKCSLTQLCLQCKHLDHLVMYTYSESCFLSVHAMQIVAFPHCVLTMDYWYV